MHETRTQAHAEVAAIAAAEQTYCRWSPGPQTRWRWAARSRTSGRWGSWATGRPAASAGCSCREEEEEATLVSPGRRERCLRACFGSTYLRKPDPTRIPAILSRATPVFTMLGSWTTPNSATVSSSPEEHTRISRSHEVVFKRQEREVDVPAGSPMICGTRTTAVKHRKRSVWGFIPTVLGGQEGLSPRGNGRKNKQTKKTPTKPVQPTSRGRRWRCRRWGCWRAGGGRCRPGTSAICCRDHPGSPGHWWLGAQELATGQKITLAFQTETLAFFFFFCHQQQVERKHVTLIAHVIDISSW